MEMSIAIRIMFSGLLFVPVVENVVWEMWGYSSVVEHSTADREVPGSNPGAPSLFCIFFF
jgi:hypothetical protein